MKRGGKPEFLTIVSSLNMYNTSSFFFEKVLWTKWIVFKVLGSISLYEVGTFLSMNASNIMSSLLKKLHWEKCLVGETKYFIIIQSTRMVYYWIKIDCLNKSSKYKFSCFNKSRVLLF